MNVAFALSLPYSPTPIMPPSRRNKNGFRCGCTWTTFPHSKARHCTQDADRRAGRQPNIPDIAADPACRRCKRCGIPFVTSRGYSLDCPMCGISIAKSSRSGSALAERDWHIFHGTHAQWQQERDEEMLCISCYQAPWVSGMTERCGPCEIEWMKELEAKQNAYNFRLDMEDSIPTRTRMAPVHEEIHRGTHTRDEGHRDGQHLADFDNMVLMLANDKLPRNPVLAPHIYPGFEFYPLPTSSQAHSGHRHDSAPIFFSKPDVLRCPDYAGLSMFTYDAHARALTSHYTVPF